MELIGRTYKETKMITKIEKKIHLYSFAPAHGRKRERKKTYFSKLIKNKDLKDNLTLIQFAPTKEITGKIL